MPESNFKNRILKIANDLLPTALTMKFDNQSITDITRICNAILADDRIKTLHPAIHCINGLIAHEYHGSSLANTCFDAAITLAQEYLLPPEQAYIFYVYRCVRHANQNNIASASADFLTALLLHPHLSSHNKFMCEEMLSVYFCYTAELMLFEGTPAATRAILQTLLWEYRLPANLPHDIADFFLALYKRNGFAGVRALAIPLRVSQEAKHYPSMSHLTLYIDRNLSERYRVDALTASIEHAPRADLVSLHAHRGFIYTARNNPSKAFADYATAIRSGTGAVGEKLHLMQCHIRRAEILVTRKEFDAAASDYTAAITLAHDLDETPKPVHLLYTTQTLLFKQLPDFEKALNYINQLSAIDADLYMYQHEDSLYKIFKRCIDISLFKTLALVLRSQCSRHFRTITTNIIVAHPDFSKESIFSSLTAMQFAKKVLRNNIPVLDSEKKVTDFIIAQASAMNLSPQTTSTIFNELVMSSPVISPASGLATDVSSEKFRRMQDYVQHANLLVTVREYDAAANDYAAARILAHELDETATLVKLLIPQAQTLLLKQQPNIEKALKYINQLSKIALFPNERLFQSSLRIVLKECVNSSLFKTLALVLQSQCPSDFREITIRVIETHPDYSDADENFFSDLTAMQFANKVLRTQIPSLNTERKAIEFILTKAKAMQLSPKTTSLIFKELVMSTPTNHFPTFFSISPQPSSPHLDASTASTATPTL